MLSKIHHVGIVVRNLEDAYAFYRDTLGLPLGKVARIADQGVKAALLPVGESEIELLEPITPDSGVARFLDNKGGGLHHLCFETDNIEVELQDAKDKGIRLIDQQPRAGLAGMIAFLHPQACCSVLVEYAQPVGHADHAEHSLPSRGRERRFSAKRLDHVVIAVKDLEAAVATYQQHFGLEREAARDAPGLGLRNTFLPIGGAKVEMVTPLGDPSPIGQFLNNKGEGLYLLSLDVDHLEGAVQTLAEGGIPARMINGSAGPMAMISPRHTHGVLLQLLSR